MCGGVVYQCVVVWCISVWHGILECDGVVYLCVWYISVWCGISVCGGVYQCVVVWYMCVVYLFVVW